MADDSYGDKTEPATPKRREEARDSGQVARSQDLTSATLLLAGLIVLSMTASTFVRSLADVMRSLLGNHYWGNPNEMLDHSLRMSLPQVVKILSPILITVAAAAFLISALQVGLHISFKPLTPRLAKLNPFQGLGRMFGGRNLMQLGMNVCKLVL